MKHRRIAFDKIAYLQLSQLGSKFSLSFSSHDVLGNLIMGLDGIRRKLLILESASGFREPFIIHLDEAKSITVKKIYCGIQAGALKSRRIDEFLKSIQLQFEFGNGKENIVLPFYERKTDSISDIPALERKVKSWQMMLSKISGITNKIPMKENG